MNDHELIKTFSELKPFKKLWDVPIIPNVNPELYKQYVIPNLIRCGAISKKDLIINHTYVGSSLNAEEAVWDGKMFIYDRYKFGKVFKDKINHFEDGNNFDVFIPLILI